MNKLTNVNIFSKDKFDAKHDIGRQVKKKTSKVFEITVNKKPRSNISRVNDILR